MVVPSDAMKGLNKAENAVNTGKTPIKKTAEPAPAPTPTPKDAPQAKVSDTVKELLTIKNFIEQNKLGVEDKKKHKAYVKAEVWQFIAQVKGLLPSFLVEDGYDDKGVYWCKTTCVLSTVSGQEISRSTMLARKDEEWLKNLDDFATMGLCETRAMARAVKNIYGYLLTAIGYQATPLEEINDTKGE